jgi:putative endonuclease
MSYYLYLLYSHSINKYYLGQTNNLNSRLHRHNLGECRSTKYGRPWSLVYFEIYHSRSEVLFRERYLKSPQGWIELQQIKEKVMSKCVCQ